LLALHVPHEGAERQRVELMGVERTRNVRYNKAEDSYTLESLKIPCIQTRFELND